MSCASNKFIAVVADAIVLLITHVHNAIIGAKAVSMNRRREFHFAANNGLNAGLFAVGHDLCIDAAIAFVDAEDDGFASCSTSALASDTARAEVRFIQFDIARERRLSLAMRCDGLANECQITVDCIAVQSS